MIALEVHQELYRLGPAEHGLPCVPHCHRPLEGTNVLHVPTEQCLGLRRPPEAPGHQSLEETPLELKCSGHF